MEYFLSDLFNFLINLFVLKNINNIFFINCLMFSFFFYYIYILKIKGDLEYKNYIYDFLYKITNNYLHLSVDCTLLSKLSNFFFVKLIDYFLDFLDYFFFYFTTYFIYPELWFWHAFSIFAFMDEKEHLKKIKEIGLHRFKYRVNLKSAFVFSKLKERWAVDFRFSFTIYILYFKIIIRCFFFFFYYINIYLYFFFRKVFFFNLKFFFIYDLYIYIYIYIFFFFYLRFKITILQKIWVIYDYVKYEWIYFFNNNLPFFFYLDLLIVFLNNFYKRTFSFFNGYRFKTSTDNIIPFTFSKNLISKILPNNYNYYYINKNIYIFLFIKYIKNKVFYFYLLSINKVFYFNRLYKIYYILLYIYNIFSVKFYLIFFLIILFFFKFDIFFFYIFIVFFFFYIFNYRIYFIYKITNIFNYLFFFLALIFIFLYD